jgi:hypothetical protein
LIPFGKIWRTGANENTTISADDVIIDGKTLKKGSSLFTIPKLKVGNHFLQTTDNWKSEEWKRKT